MISVCDCLGRGIVPVADLDALKRVKEILVQRQRAIRRREPVTFLWW